MWKNPKRQGAFAEIRTSTTSQINALNVKSTHSWALLTLTLNMRPRLVQAPPEHGAKRMSGTLGLTLEPGGMARFQADLVIPQELANQVYGLLEALSGTPK
jgi:hypothetical protein